MEFWNDTIFAGVAKSFGELLLIDLTTVSKRRLTFSCICVGVVEGVDMPDFVSFHSKLGVHKQKMTYEMIPFVCFNCLKSRHKASKCPNAKEVKKGPPPTSTSENVVLEKDKRKVWK